APPRPGEGPGDGGPLSGLSAVSLPVEPVPDRLGAGGLARDRAGRWDAKALLSARASYRLYLRHRRGRVGVWRRHRGPGPLCLVPVAGNPDRASRLSSPRGLSWPWAALFS